MITKITARNFRGISLREVAVGPGGVLAKGRIGIGKSSLLKAVQAALEGRDIGPDAIRIGESRAEVVIDMDDMSIRRAITANGSTLTVRTAAGDIKSKPVAFLAALFGSSIDPCALLLAKPKERVQMVQAAIPCKITAAEIRERWVPGLPDIDCSGHGLEVINAVREFHYEKRTAANAAEKAAAAEATRLEGIAAGMPAHDGAFSVEYAETYLRDARATLTRLEAQDAAARAAIDRTASTRARVAELRAQSEALLVPVAQVDALDAVMDAAASRLIILREQLRDAEAEHKRAADASDAARRSNHQAATIGKQADDLAAMLANVGPEPVEAEAIESARAEALAAEESIRIARADAARQVAQNAAARARAVHTAAKAEADRLDAIVKALTDDAPKALIEASGGIEGLSIEGDDVALDGVKFGGVNEGRKIQFAVEIAKRANAKGKVLIVDGLERLDPESQQEFIANATSDGWQIFVSSVASGDLVDIAIGAAS